MRWGLPRAVKRCKSEMLICSEGLKSHKGVIWAAKGLILYKR